jgi:tripartite-type tricarboxylate transporter receptor subunit TctC
MPFAGHALCRDIAITALAVAAFAIDPAFAQSAGQWPERPVRLLVTVGAGGAADTLARNLSNGFSQFANGQPLIVDNRSGAGGTIAAAAVAREKPDGYTLFLAEVGPNAVSHVLTGKLPYDPHTAFTPIIHAANFPAVVLIRPTLPYMTLAEFIAPAKQHRESSIMRLPARAIGRICSWPISTAERGSTRSTSSIARVRKC